MDSHRQALRRGFNWLGGALVLAKVADFGTILVVLLYLTKEQVGVASLVVAIGSVIEALDGLGTSTALVQAPSLSRLQLDSLFWFIAGGAVLVAAVTLLAAPWIATLSGAAGMAIYLLAVAIKQPLVGAAVIPLALMNRDLQYERIAIVNICSSITAAATRLSLAVLGAGAWAIVAAYAAAGLYTLIGALIARPFRPGLRFSMAPIAPLVRFGLRATTSSLFQQAFSNVDFLLVGLLYGAAPLAVYRVAFEVAMQPASAASTLVNRTALPVFARVASDRGELARSLTWSLRRLMIVVAPLAAATFLAADSIAKLIHDGDGRTYAAAGLPLKLLALAALLRVISQLLYPLVLATGRPQTAARLSAATLFMATAGMLLVGHWFPEASGIVGISAVWLAVYPVLLFWGARYVRRRWEIRLRDLARTLWLPLASAFVLVAIVEMGRLVIGAGDAWLQVGWVVAAVALTYTGLMLPHRRSLPTA